MTRWYRSTDDLLVAAVWTVVASVAVLVLGIEQQQLRILLVTPLVIFIPGYAILAALYPTSPTEGESNQNGLTVPEATRLTGIDGLERLVLAVVVSLGFVPLVGFVVNYTPYGLRLQPVMLAVAGLTVLFIVLAFVRRTAVPKDRRYHVAPFRTVSSLWSRYVGGDDAVDAPSETSEMGRRRRGPLVPSSNTHRVLNVLFVVSLLVLVGSVGFAAVTPVGDNDQFSEVYLVTETAEGEYSSENLPRQFTAGETETLVVAIGNHEHRQMSYTVVTTLSGEELSRFDTAVDTGDTAYVERKITPNRTGDELPLRFLVYRGEPPQNPAPENAYRTATLWVSVE